MSTIVLRSVKGTPLTNTEVDANFSNLNTDKIEIGGTYSSGTASGVLFLNASKVLTTGSALTFDGTNFASSGIITSTNANGLRAQYPSSASYYAQLDSRDGNTYLSAVGSTAAIVFRATDGPGTTAEGMRLTSTGLGIGTSSPAFKLDVGGDNGTNIALRSTGTASAVFRAYVNSAEAGTIGFLNGGGTYFEVAGTEGMRLTSTGLGIGTSSPTQKLDVRGSMYMAATNARIYIDNGGVGGSSIQLGASGTSYGYVGTDGNFPLVFQPNNTEQMRLDSSGNLGLGVTPSSTIWSGDETRLIVKGNGASKAGVLGLQSQGTTNATTAFFVAEDLRAGASLGTSTNSFLALLTNGTERARIDASGNLGIGTSSPSFKLDVSGANAQSIRVTSTNGDLANLVMNSTGNASWSLSSDTVMRFRKDSTEYMRLDSSGNLGIGTSSPTDKLHVVGLARINTGTYAAGYGLTFQANSETSRTYQMGMVTGGNFAIYDSAAAATRVTLDTSGNLGIGTSSPASKLVVSASGAAGFEVNPDGVGSAPALVAYNRSTSAYIQLTSLALQHVWQNSGTEAMRLDSTGLGIGTSSPTNKLEVASSTTNTGITIYNNNGSGGQNARLGFKSLNGYDGSSVLAAVTAVPNAAGNTATSLVFSTSGDNSAASAGLTERMRLDASGNLGLGVTPSGWSLSGLAAMQVKNGGLYGYDLTEVGVTSNAYYGSSSWRYISSAQATRFVQVSGQHQWFTAPSGTAGNAISFSQVMTLDADGDLGIGTTSPTSKLTIGTGTYSAAASGTAGLYATAAGLTVLSDSVFFASRTGGDRMLLDSSGNLGLGVTPSAWVTLKPLEIAGLGNAISGFPSDAGIYVTSNAYYGSAGWRYGQSGKLATRYSGESGIHSWSVAPSGTAGNAISFTQAMSLNADGQWLLNTTSPIYSNADAAHIYGRVSGGNQFGLMIGGDAASYTCYAARFLTNNSGAVVGSITFNTSATAYNTSSDYRLKNITGPITTSGAYIDSLNPVEGTWKADGSTFVGLIAHEVQEASRTNVATGVKDGEQMQAMDYSNAELIANLIAEVKSLRQRLAAAGI